MGDLNTLNVKSEKYQTLNNFSRNYDVYMIIDSKYARDWKFTFETVRLQTLIMLVIGGLQTIIMMEMVGLQMAKYSFSRR